MAEQPIAVVTGATTLPPDVTDPGSIAAFAVAVGERHGRADARQGGPLAQASGGGRFSRNVRAAAWPFSNSRCRVCWSMPKSVAATPVVST